jgi:LEA14-like dessication related protein
LSIERKINSNTENLIRKKSATIADRMEKHWSGNGEKAPIMHMINIQLKSKGSEKKSLTIKLKASKISDDVLNDLPVLVKKFF